MVFVWTTKLSASLETSLPFQPKSEVTAQEAVEVILEHKEYIGIFSDSILIWYVVKKEIWRYTKLGKCSLSCLSTSLRLDTSREAHNLNLLFSVQL